jgi:hypothetical protein
MEDFALKAGGELKLTTRASGEVRLCTVISELRPGQVVQDIKLAPAKKKPDWDRLAARAENHPPLQQFNVQSALTEYKRFLALKITKKDQTSEQFAPSPDVDKEWHLHLSFPEEYQQDVLAFAKVLKVASSGGDKPLVIPHCPFLMEESKSRYEATYRSIKDKKLESIVGAKADMDFWPTVEEVWPPSEESDNQANCGGCGGCC